MCGIVGFTSKQQAAPILLDGRQSWNIEDMILQVSLSVTAAT